MRPKNEHVAADSHVVAATAPLAHGRSYCITIHINPSVATRANRDLVAFLDRH
jgi:hypothetical protein